MIHPRFQEKNEFSRKYFDDENLWLDLSRTFNDHFQSSNGQMFARKVSNEYINSFMFLWKEFEDNRPNPRF